MGKFYAFDHEKKVFTRLNDTTEDGAISFMSSNSERFTDLLTHDQILHRASSTRGEYFFIRPENALNYYEVSVRGTMIVTLPVSDRSAGVKEFTPKGDLVLFQSASASATRKKLQGVIARLQQLDQALQADEVNNHVAAAVQRLNHTSVLEAGRIYGLLHMQGAALASIGDRIDVTEARIRGRIRRAERMALSPTANTASTPAVFFTIGQRLRKTIAILPYPPHGQYTDAQERERKELLFLPIFEQAFMGKTGTEDAKLLALDWIESLCKDSSKIFRLADHYQYLKDPHRIMKRYDVPYSWASLLFNVLGEFKKL